MWVVRNFFLPLATMFALFGSISACTTPSRQSSPLLGILHYGHGEDHLEIHVIHPDGQDARHIMDIPVSADEVYLAAARIKLSPTGEYVALVENANSGLMPGDDNDSGTLHLLKTSTGETAVVAENVAGGVYSDIVWSPDGTMLAYCEMHKPSEGHTARRGMRIIEVTSNRLIVLGSNDTNLTCNQQVWSPDSRYLAVAGFQSEVTVYAVREGEARWQSSILDTLPGNHNYFCNLAWSPDSMKLAFSVGCTTLGIPVEPADWYETYIADIGNDEVIEIANLMQEDLSGLAWGSMYPYWSPDGRIILVFFSYLPPPDVPRSGSLPSNGILQFDIGTATSQIQGVDAARLPVAADAMYFAWSEQNNLAWLSDNGWVLASFNDSALRYTPVAVKIPLGCWPQWSPDGDALAFTQISACGIPTDSPGVYVFSPSTEEITNASASLGGDNLLLGWIPER
jgi:Tol biopolymer transport system component